MMRAEETALPGCHLLHPGVRGDARGWFLKTAHASTLEGLGLRSDWREDFASVSAKGVLRGMHFQTPPAGHAKLVTCLAGSVLDVALDLRRGSPTYGRHAAFTLSPQRGTLLYLATGIAHGFVALEDDSLMYYKVTSEHAPASDAGIAWDSFGFDWPVAAPLLSDRDAGHPPLAGFATPFVFDPADPAR